MPRILFITTISSTLRAFLLPHAKHFREQGWEVDAMASGISSCPDCRREFNRTFDVNWSRNPLDFRNMLAAPRRVREVLARHQYDIVHVHTPVAAFVARYALRRARKSGNVKVIYTAHGFHFYKGCPRVKGSVFLALEKAAARWTDYLVVMNRMDFEAAESNRLVPPDRLFHTPGIGLDTRQYGASGVTASEVLAIRSELGLGPDQPLFLAVAEFIPRKRHADLIQAFARVQCPKSHLALSGSGPLFDAMKQLALELGIADRIHFLGYRRDVPALILASTATVLVSSQEGLPRSVMESMSLGVPVIGTDIRGTSDLLSNGNGVLVPLGDRVALSNALDWVIANPEETRAMAESARAKIAAYDLNNVLRVHEALYAEALSPAKGVPISAGAR